MHSPTKNCVTLTDDWKQFKHLLTKAQRAIIIEASDKLAHDLLKDYLQRYRAKQANRIKIRAITVNLDGEVVEQFKALVPGFNLSQWVRDKMVEEKLRLEAEREGKQDA